MTNWLEDAEQRQEHRLERSQRYVEKIQQKKNFIKTNYLKNAKEYEHFISVVNNLTDRVNALPLNDRQPFKKIHINTKKSKLDNKLNILSSSKRLEKRKNSIILPFFKEEHYKHIRVLYVCVSDNADMADIEIKETQLMREKLKQKSKPEKKIAGMSVRSRQRHHQIDEPAEERLHVLYSFPISGLNEKIAMEIIEWLAFRKELQDISIYNEIEENDKKFLGRKV
jgi:hypothetical protein